MARREAIRAAAVYHIIVAILLLVLGGGMLGFGIWLRVSNSGGPSDLIYKNTGFFNIVLSASVISIIIGCFLLLSAVVALVALSQKCVGKVFRVLYIVLALVILAALVLVAVVCFLIVANRSSDAVKSILRDAWKRTVVEDGDSICAIEKLLNCRGFTDPECSVAGECVTNCPGGSAGAATKGCYSAILGDLQKVYLPLAIVSTIVAFLVLVDLFVTCAL